MVIVYYIYYNLFNITIFSIISLTRERHNPIVKINEIIYVIPKMVSQIMLLRSH